MMKKYSPKDIEKAEVELERIEREIEIYGKRIAELDRLIKLNGLAIASLLSALVLGLTLIALTPLVIRWAL